MRSDMSSVCNFCAHSLDVILGRKAVVALQNVGCFLRLHSVGLSIP